MGKNLLGNLVFKKFEYKDSIDLEEFTQISLNDIFKKTTKNNGSGSFKQFINIDWYENGKIAIAHVNKSKELTVSIIDQFGLILRSLDIGIDCKIIHQFKTYNGFIILFASFNHTWRQVYIIDPKFEVKTIKIDNLLTIDINDKIIYYLNTEGEIKILYHELRELRTVKLHNKPRYFIYAGRYHYFQIKYQLNKFYCINYQGIYIYDENTGTVLKSIEIIFSESVSFDGEGNILALWYKSHQLPWLFVYSSNGIFIKKIAIPDLQSIYSDNFFYFRIDKNENFIFLDTHFLILYIL